MNQFTRAFQPEKLAEAWQIVQRDFPEALWETVYVTVLATLFAIIIGLPLGMLLVAGDAKGIRPMPGILMKVINVVINLLRSIPFLILILHQGLNCVAAFRRYKGEQMAELQAEKDALEKQRQQSELMMQQLLEMKQQMTGQAPPREDPAVEAMRAELEALRSQLAAQKKDENA